MKACAHPRPQHSRHVLLLETPKLLRSWPVRAHLPSRLETELERSFAAARFLPSSCRTRFDFCARQMLQNDRFTQQREQLYTRMALARGAVAAVCFCVFSARFLW